MFELPESEKYAVRPDVFKELIDNAVRGFIKQQNEVIKQMLADLDISETDFIAHGSKQEVNGATRLFYKDKAIAIFYAPNYDHAHDTIKLTQNYRLYK